MDYIPPLQDVPVQRKGFDGALNATASCIKPALQLVSWTAKEAIFNRISDVFNSDKGCLRRVVNLQYLIILASAAHGLWNAPVSENGSTYGALLYGRTIDLWSGFKELKMT